MTKFFLTTLSHRDIMLEVTICGRGGIGRRARLRIWWLPRAGSSPVARTKKDCNFDTKLQSFLIKSASVGINPPMVDEIATL